MTVLTPSEREKLLHAISLTQQLLLAGEEELVKPWWEAPELEDEEEEEKTKTRYGATPVAMRVPPSMIDASSHGPQLIYNLCAILCIPSLSPSLPRPIH